MAASAAVLSPVGIPGYVPDKSVAATVTAMPILRESPSELRAATDIMKK